MNPMILSFVALLAVSSASAGVAHLPEQHDGYQTPFVPISGPQLSASGYEAALPAEPLPVAQAYHSAQYESAPIQTAQYEAVPVQAQYAAAPVHAHYETAPVQAHYETAPVHAQYAAAPVHAHYEAAPVHAHYEAAPIATPLAVSQHVQPFVAPQPTVQVQKTIIKHIQVPYPVDKYVKVDRHVPYYVDRHYKVDRPYEVVKYIQKPYIVKVERKVHVPIITKVPVPQPQIQIEPIVAEPQHVRSNHHEAQHHPW